MKRFAPLLAAVMLFAGGAAAADLSPRGGWVVGPIGTKAQDGRGFCSMKNAYSNGVALVFARDAAGSNSVAVEFTAKKFEAGRQYPVTLSIGPVERRAEALAATEKVLVMQMGNDDIFYDMLARKSALTAALEADSFSFGLQGTSKALIALDNCAAALNAGQKPRQVKVGLPPVFADIDEGFDAPIVGSAYATGETIIRVTHPHAEQPLETRREGGGASLEVERLRAENKALELENEAALARLKAAELKKAETDNKLEASIAAREQVLREENDKLQGELAALRGSQAESETLASRLREIETQNAGLRREKEQARLALLTAKTQQQVAVTPRDSGVKSILAAAHIPGVERMAGEAYNWQTAELYGSAEEFPRRQGQNVHAAAESYIAATASKCAGDFAYKLGDTTRTGTRETAEAEVACIDGVNDAAAAVLFVAEPDRLVVITHEGAAAQMETALQKRSQVAASLK